MTRGVRWIDRQIERGILRHQNESPFQTRPLIL